jgi:hypothetical protein
MTAVKNLIKQSFKGISRNGDSFFIFTKREEKK